jgi:tetratricopeptide (TPR) repeat protein
MRPHIRTFLAFSAVLLTAWLAYLPGLSGQFLFDDFPNLAEIGATGPVDDWPTFFRYITSGTADPLGRPLALLSFLVDARDWPASPGPFLRTNVLLHLLNGALLFGLLRSLGRCMDGDGPRTDGAALLAAGLWLLHPLFVSTTLYVVQRQAMLPATFVLLGLLAYVRGRALLDRAPRTGAAWMAAGILGGTGLALLCKANGLLLPLLAWAIDATVLRASLRPPPGDAAGQRRLRLLRRLLLVLPSLLLFTYLASFLGRLDAAIDRPWTIGQRLLTEPRVLLDYLHLLVVPRVLSTGLYNDDYPVSAGLLAPAATLPSLLAIAALVALGFRLRRRLPAVAAALLFFFAGHLLESTVVPLELYFEHRNYLPAMLLFWPLARWLSAWNAAPRARMAAGCALLALLAAITWQRASLWGQPEQLARLWALQNPGSARAQATAATYDLRGRRPDLAMARLRELWDRQPHDLQLALNYANAACARQGLRQEEVRAIGEALRRADSGDQLVHRWLGRALDVAGAGRCPGLDVGTVADWVDQAWRNPRLSAYPGRRQDLHSLRGRLALERGEPERALAQFDRALDEWVTPGAAARQAALLAEQGHYELALRHLDHYAQRDQETVRPTGWGMAAVHQWVLDRQGYWPRELAILREKLRAEIEGAAAPRGAAGSPP